MAHTPGPWTYDKDASKIIAGNPHGRDCLEVDLVVGLDWDGYLIAAAPDLLYCLDELLKHIEWRGPNDCTHRARAAIAKATGE